MNLGSDLGSTYSSFSTYNKATGLVELCKPTHSESEAVPSIACLDEDDHLLTGHEAREELRDNADTTSFEAFKMLLTENRQEILKERGYDAEYTPRYITERFLEQQVRKILTGRREEKVENLVICVPEFWNTKAAADRGRLDGRSILQSICSKFADQVQVVCEPAAASAYYAWQYRKTTGSPMKGNVLIVDYGGGTLDLTLTQVSSEGKDQEAVEIEVKQRTGVGDNHPGRIGDAGIAYMEKVIRLAVAECPDLDIEDPEELDPKEPIFWKTYTNLERKLKGQSVPGGSTSSREEDSYRLYNAVEDCLDDISQLEENEEVFTTVRYGKTKVNVTFSHLARAYNTIIRDQLDECLRYMTNYMDDAKIDYESSNNDQFHVILVGGFCKFILVQNQIQEFFDASSTGDLRFAFDLGENREFAVAMGAALLADKIMVIRHTAPYAIGVVSYTADKRPVPNFAIHFREVISASQEFWIGGEKPKQFINAAGGVGSFLIGYDDKGKQQHKLVIKPKLARKIEAAYEKLAEDYAAKFPNASRFGLAHNLGFRMDESEIVSLLIRAVKTGTVEEIRLSSYQDMFELTEV